jgi:hypothetical protein
MIDIQIKQLEKQHTKLDKEIDTLEKTGKFSDIQMQQLKKERLMIRDELSRLRKKQYAEQEYLDINEERR